MYIISLCVPNFHTIPSILKLVVTRYGHRIH